VEQHHELFNEDLPETVAEPVELTPEQKEIAGMRSALFEAVQHENYEEAAKLRDAIRAREGRNADEG